MATKLKKISRNVFLKAIAFILIIASVFGILLSIYEVKDVRYFEALIKENFVESTEHAQIYTDSIRNLIEALNWYNYLENYNRAMVYFKRNQGIYYNATDGTDIVKNTSFGKEGYKSFGSYAYISNERVDLNPDSLELRSYISMLINEYTGNNPSSFRYEINLGLSEYFLQTIIVQWNKDRQTLIEAAKIVILLILEILISFVYLLFVTGKKGSDNEMHLSFLDKLLFTDLNLAIIAIPTYLGMKIIINNPNFNYYNNISTISLILLACSVNLMLVLSLVRHIKNKSFIKHSLIYIVLSTTYKTLYKLYRFVIELFFSGPLMIKAMLVLVLFTIACIAGIRFFPLTIVAFLTAVYFIFIYVKKFNLIKQIVRNIKSGDIKGSITATITGKGELDMLANDINCIAEGLDKAVKNEVKSQRMKSELISNVSHDIKTPLTSIINYVDLLKKEGMNSENAIKYLGILEQKSQRLKILTEDLFEAAKASSGDMPIELQRLDIFYLIQQGLAELDDRIEKSELHFKVNIPEEKIYVLADGRLLWRVIENLLSNVFKYALKGSRVYIDVINNENSDKISLIIKNISSYELNVAVDELMERFKRADESRSSDGSGLGLAIAKDLMEMQKGSLNLEIDGDLFKAIVNIPKCETNDLIDEEAETI